MPATVLLEVYRNRGRIKYCMMVDVILLEKEVIYSRFFYFLGTYPYPLSFNHDDDNAF